MAKREPRNPEWVRAEQVAALLERTLTPGARVTHNERLPNLRTGVGTRQCDVVVRTGHPPREWLAIVEVQKRKSKPDITTFHGWCQKMRDVGAQRLVCVSAKGYPKSVILDAQTHGPTVMLATLREIEHDQRPVALALGTFIVHDTIVRIEKVWTDADEIDATQPVPHDAQLFVLDGEAYSLNEIARRAAQLAEPATKAPRSGNRKLAVDREFLFMQGDTLVPLRLTLDVVLEVKEFGVPVTFSEYQSIEGGALAWVAAAKIDSPDVAMDLHISWRADADGIIRPAGTQILGANPGMNLSVTLGSGAVHIMSKRTAPWRAK